VRKHIWFAKRIGVNRASKGWRGDDLDSTKPDITGRCVTSVEEKNPNHGWLTRMKKDLGRFEGQFWAEYQPSGPIVIYSWPELRLGRSQALESRLIQKAKVEVISTSLFVLVLHSSKVEEAQLVGLDFLKYWLREAWSPSGNSRHFRSWRETGIHVFNSCLPVERSDEKLRLHEKRAVEPNVVRRYVSSVCQNYPRFGRRVDFEVSKSLVQGKFWPIFFSAILLVPKIPLCKKDDHGNNGYAQTNSRPTHPLSALTAWLTSKEKEGTNRRRYPYPSNYLIDGIEQEIDYVPKHLEVLLCVAVGFVLGVFCSALLLAFRKYNRNTKTLDRK
jgi:hypothetical protein